MGNKNTPAVSQTPVCKLGRRCHVSGQGIRKFGNKFTRSLVQELASSSVQLVLREPGQAQKWLASGTLISSKVVLCAAHSLQGISAKQLEILMFFECDTNTAAPGASYQHQASRHSTWLSCTTLASNPQAKVIKVLEIGKSGDDYALLAIKWKNAQPTGVAGQETVRLPRIPDLPKPGRNFTEELLLIGHPWERPYQAEPKQASAGLLTEQFGPNPLTGKGSDYGYASFGREVGMSGGGVYNDEGELIGVLKGAKVGKGSAFLNLGRIADKTSGDSMRGRISEWMKGGYPFKKGDFPQDSDIVFTK